MEPEPGLPEPGLPGRTGEGFLTAEQQRRYGRYTGEPDQAQLDRYFHLDATDRDLVDVRRGEHNRLGFAVQLGTVRFLGTFLPDPTDVPWSVAGHLAGQLGVADPGLLKQYAARDGTNRLHAGPGSSTFASSSRAVARSNNTPGRSVDSRARACSQPVRSCCTCVVVALLVIPRLRARTTQRNQVQAREHWQESQQRVAKADSAQAAAEEQAARARRERADAGLRATDNEQATRERLTEADHQRTEAKGLQDRAAGLDPRLRDRADGGPETAADRRPGVRQSAPRAASVPADVRV